MTNDIHFGTDGWRGKIAANYTFDNVKRCTQGFSSYLLSMGYSSEPVVVGYDMRFLSEQFALSAAEVLIGNGFKVFLTNQATPTPVIAFSIINKQAVGGINITASHNPPWDNGFKVRNEFGGAIDPVGLKKIEELIPNTINDILSKPANKGMAQGEIITFDPAPDYIKHLTTLVDINRIRNAGLRVLVDPMWGNGVGWFPRLLAGGNTIIKEIHNTRNPIFPNMNRPEPIPPNIDAGLKFLKEYGADVLIITDGDADRLGIGDENGVFVDQLRVFALLAYYLLEVLGERGPIVKTLSTTNMLKKLADLYNIPVYETGVGFKYVAPKMIEVHAMIGGEESGGYAFHGHVPERDGILAGLYILDMMVQLKRKPSGLIDLLFSKIGKHYYDRIDSIFDGDKSERATLIEKSNPDYIGGLKVTGFDKTDGYKYNLEDGGWMLIRFSGTEPIIRVYTETMHEDKVQRILLDGLNIAGLK